MKRIINLLLILCLLLQILVIPVYAAEVSQFDIRGTVWNIDVNKTTAANDCSMRMLFGTAWVEYGDEMNFYADNSFPYYIGAGIGGKGTYSINDEISYEIVTYEEELIENGILSFENDCIVQKEEELVIYWKKTDDLMPSDGLLNGDFSKYAGVYSEPDGTTLKLLKNGLRDIDISDGCIVTEIEKTINSEYIWIPNGTYTWSISDEQGLGFTCILYPVGVKVISFDGSILPTDTTKPRLWMGQDVVADTSYIWTKQDEKMDKIRVILNDEKVEFDQPPGMINDRVMVPMRKIFEELGATVEWEGDTQAVTAIRGITFVKIAIGSNTLSITGIRNEDISLDSPAQLINGRTYVPVRAVSEALNTVVSWNGDEQTVYISTYDGDKNINAVIVNADSELTINDAALFREVLLKNKLGNVDEKSISVATEPSESGFDVLIRKLVSLSDDDDISYLFYTGHGGHTENEVVIAPDYSSVSRGTYEYTMLELIDCLEEIRGTIVVILDSCYSGAINDLNFDRNKFKIITACASDECSFTENIVTGIATVIFNNSVVNGKFSSVMLNGLGAYEDGGVFNKYNEKVKADYDKDHNVTVAELYRYIEENIDKESEDRNGNVFYQNPTCSDSKDETVIYSY